MNLFLQIIVILKYSSSIIGEKILTVEIDEINSIQLYMIINHIHMRIRLIIEREHTNMHMSQNKKLIRMGI